MANNQPKLLYFATPYAFSVSLAYLYGYWSTFDINIFEYISFADVIKLSLFPILISMWAFAIGILLRIVKDIDTSTTNNTKSTWEDRWLIGWKKYMIMMSLVIYMVLMSGLNYLWLILPFVISMWITDTIFRLVDMGRLFPYLSYATRYTILYFLIVLLLGSFAHGKINAHDILIGHKTQFVSTSIFKDKTLFAGDGKLKFLGIAGSYMIFLSNDNSMSFIIKAEQIPILELSKPSFDINISPLSKLPEWISKLKSRK